MSRSWTAYLAGAAFALCATASGIAYAQTSAADAQRDAEQDARGTVHIERHVERHVEHGDALGDGGGERHFERRMIIRDDHEGHHMAPAEHLRTMLQLKPGQEAALTAYLAAVKPTHHPEHIVEMSDRHDAKTTPKRLAEMEAHMAEQASQSHARIEATRKFYDQLEPSQKKVFDQMPMMMFGPMGPMMPMMGNMKVMVRMEGMPPMPPLVATPPHPPMSRTPPIPPAPHS
ncbi:Spy/CpxP family protein refolding chaperone [Phenylobacterium sp.]|uniref:Spy/CpxP family protein refolding chaperone n=1 Tax=Phenylobacterium sp. TaxID=1871053 RepID=UPI00374D67C7